MAHTKDAVPAGRARCRCLRCEGQSFRGLECVLRLGLQGYLAPENPPPPRTLQ